MKHTFVIIDKLLILLKVVPLSLDAEKDKVKARKIIDLIEEYTHTLRKLIESHRTKKYLDRLHHAHIKEIADWAEQVTALFKKLDSLMIVLEEDMEKLERVVKHEPERWQDVVARMSMGIVMVGLHDDEDDLKRLRQIAIFEMHELEAIISHKKHVPELHALKDVTEIDEYDRLIKEFFERLLN